MEPNNPQNPPINPVPEQQAYNVAPPAPLPPAPTEPMTFNSPAVQTPAETTDENPDKNYLLALLISYFLGTLGIDRMYLGKVGTGIAKLVTFGGFGIWAFIDFLLLAFGKLKAKGDNRPLEGFAKNRGWVKLATIAVIIFTLVVIIAVSLLFMAGTPSLSRNADRVEDQFKEQTMQVEKQAPNSDDFNYPDSTRSTFED